MPSVVVVVVDGVRYTPASSQKFGVAISTHRRAEVLAKTLPKVLEVVPEGTPVFLTCDDQDTYQKAVQAWGSKLPKRILKTKPGVYNSKNAGLDVLMTQTNVEHIFLLDDDVYPKGLEAFTAYIDAPEQHYAHSWDLPVVYRDGDVVACTRSGGTVLYATRQVIEQVGGMRSDFGTWGCEHVNWSDRIHNQGLTRFRYQDLPAAYDGELWHEFDRKELQPKMWSGVKTKQQIEVNREKFRLYEKLRATDREFVEYRQKRVLHVVTVFMTGKNPQTGKEFTADVSQLQTLYKSLRDRAGKAHLHVLTDIPESEFKDFDSKLVSIVPVEQSVWLPIDWHRWFLIRDYLPEVGRRFGGLHNLSVWHVDATDTEFLRYTDFPLDILRVGWEPAAVGCEWILKQLPQNLYRDWFVEYADRGLVNPGVLGGDGAKLQAFLEVLCGELGEAAYWCSPKATRDMVPFQRAAGRFGLDAGWPGVTVFKSNGEFGREYATWRHK